MKNFLSILLFLALLSCNKQETLVENQTEVLTHAELGFPLEEPVIILNELAQGTVDRNIHTIRKQNASSEDVWEFEYLPNSDRVAKMTYYETHYQCQQTVLDVTYNADNLIASIQSVRKNECQEYKELETYVYNYNQNGVLKSIFRNSRMASNPDKDLELEQNYFSYYPNGKVKTIYNNVQRQGLQPRFGEQHFYYDREYNNVTKVEHKIEPSYHHVYEYTYDNKENPYKGFFVAVSLYLPHIGHAYLSTNNAVKIMENNVHNLNNQGHTYQYFFNYSANNQLDSYSNENNTPRPYALYKVN